MQRMRATPAIGGALRTLRGAVKPALAELQARTRPARVPRCARATHGTCAACGRHRPLEDGPDGQRLCRPCREEGERPYETCGRGMPAGYGRRWRVSATPIRNGGEGGLEQLCEPFEDRHQCAEALTPLLGTPIVEIEETLARIEPDAQRKSVALAGQVTAPSPR